MKTTLRLLFSSLTVAAMTLAASGAPLPFLASLLPREPEPAGTLAAPLAPESGQLSRAQVAFLSGYD